VIKCNLIGMVRAFNEAPDAEDLLQRIDLVPLLSGETRVPCQRVHVGIFCANASHGTAMIWW
jgi:hypothetical protein